MVTKTKMQNSKTKVCAGKTLNPKYVQVTLKSILNSLMNICSEGEVLQLISPSLNSSTTLLQS